MRGKWNEPSVTAEHQHVNMLTLAFSLYFYTCRPFILSTVYSPCVDFLFCFKWSNVNHVKGAVTVLLHASQTKCHLDNSEAYAGSHCAEFICILNCCFLCFWMCFSHSLELSFLFSFLQNEKPLGHSASRSSNISKVSKAHTNGKISMSDVWLSSTTEREIYTPLMDDMPLLHHNAPISADPWTDMSLHLSSPAQHASQSDWS